jgi:hypothetical protein
MKDITDKIKQVSIEPKPIYKKQNFAERHPFKFAWFCAFIGAIAALVLQKLAQIMHLL